MEMIRNYVEAMFKDIAPSKETMKIKMNIIDSMESKYQDLIAGGMNEKEALGVMIIIFAMVLQYSLTELLDVAAPIATSLFIFGVAVAVLVFIYSGIKKSMYEQLLDTEKENKEDEHNGTLFAITMPLATLIFLFLGFMYHLWHIAWIIFPLTALLSTSVNVLLNWKRGGKNE